MTTSIPLPSHLARSVRFGGQQRGRSHAAGRVQAVQQAVSHRPPGVRLSHQPCACRARAGDVIGDQSATPAASYDDNDLLKGRGLSPDDLPTQGQSVVSPQRGTAVAERDTGGGADFAYLSVRCLAGWTVERRPFRSGRVWVWGGGVSAPGILDARVSCLCAPLSPVIQELMAIQQQGPRDIGFFGTRNMGFLHQQLIEILSYAMVLTENHIFTSGATGTNAAVIRGALRAERPDLLTVVLPQSLSRQPPESQEMLSRVANVVEMPQNDSLTLAEASRICNADILRRCQQVICFAFHDSRLLLDTCEEAKQMRKMVTLFYLD